MKPLIKHTKVIQKTETPDGKPRVSQVVFPLSKARTLDKLKDSLPFPSKFFLELNRHMVATFKDVWGSSVTLQLIEVDPQVDK